MDKHSITQTTPQLRASGFLESKISEKFQWGHPEWKCQIQIW